MLGPEALKAISESAELKVLAEKYEVSVDSLSKSFRAISPRLMDGTADVGGFGLAVLSGAFGNIQEDQIPEKGQDLLNILFKDEGSKDSIISEAAKASELTEAKIKEMMPGLACFIAQFVTNAMSTESSEIMEALTGGPTNKKIL